MSDKKQEIADFFANPNWHIDANTPDHINDYFNKTWGCEAPVEPDLTPIFHGGVLIGSRQDLKDGLIDPTDRDKWKP